MKRLSELKDLQISQITSSNDDIEEPLSITGLETFSLSFKVSNNSSFSLYSRIYLSSLKKKKKEKRNLLIPFYAGQHVNEAPWW